MARSWKAAERAIAARLGGERVPVTGRVRGWAPDVEHAWLAIEVKSWAAGMPRRVVAAMDQAIKAAEWAKRRGKGDRLPVAIIHQDRRDHGNDYIVLRLKDFQDWFGSTSRPATDQAPQGDAATNGDHPTGIRRSLGRA